MGEEEKKEEEKKPKEKFALNFDYFNETRLGILALVVGAVIAILPVLPAVVKGAAAILVILWGADSVRKVSRYGLGTGVPSIGVLAVGFGIVGAMGGMAIGSAISSPDAWIAPGVLAGVAFIALIGYVAGVFSNNEKFIGMKIPGLERAMCELATAGALAIILECSMVAGSWHFSELMKPVIGGVAPFGFVAVMFIMSGFGMLQPYNSCLGADERRGRTLRVATEIGGLICIILGIVTAVTLISGFWGLPGTVEGASVIVLGVIVWIASYVSFMKLCMKEAYSTVGTGLIKTMMG